MRIGILTSGGDCPGINATIRGVCKTAINNGNEVVGILSGFKGIMENNMIPLTENSMSGLLNMGGTILGTSREKPFKKQPSSSDDLMRHILIDNIRNAALDCIVCIGGNGTLKTAYKLSQIGINIISIPKTIDNDVWGTDFCFGFDTAVSIATEAIDRLHSTASSHQRVMIIEVMGHKAGWIALYSGMAGGGDIILLPELEYSIENIKNAIIARERKGKPYSIVVVAEGIKTENNMKAGEYIAKKISESIDLEIRETVLGYVQRGGSPTAYDRNLATRMGGYATDMIMRGEFNRMVSLKGTDIISLPLEEVAGKLKLVPEDNELLIQGKRMGICFG